MIQAMITWDDLYPLLSAMMPLALWLLGLCIITFIPILKDAKRAKERLQREQARLAQIEAKRLLAADEPAQEPFIAALRAGLRGARALELAQALAGEDEDARRDAALRIVAGEVRGEEQRALLVLVIVHSKLERMSAGDRLMRLGDADAIMWGHLLLTDEELDALSSAYSARHELGLRLEAGDPAAVAAFIRWIDAVEWRYARGQADAQYVTRYFVPTHPDIIARLAAHEDWLHCRPRLISKVVIGESEGLLALTGPNREQLLALDALTRERVLRAALEADTLGKAEQDVRLRNAALTLIREQGGPGLIPALLAAKERAGLLERGGIESAIEAIRARHTAERGQLTVSEGAQAEGGLEVVRAEAGALDQAD